MEADDETTLVTRTSNQRRGTMSIRIWLKTNGEVEISKLQASGKIGDVKIETHDTTLKKYIDINVDPTDPTIEIPVIPKEITERITFKGNVCLFGVTHSDYLPSGSFHDKDTTTHMLVSSNPKENYKKGYYWVEVSVSSPSLEALKDILFRLQITKCVAHEPGRYYYITNDIYRTEDFHSKIGCFKNFTC